MKSTKRQVALLQIELTEKIQALANVNIVECNGCGTILLHDRSKEKLSCLCGKEMYAEDCADYWYSGIENNSEFNN